ncbi:MAG: tyrosine-protein phosphatase [Proteobacteria bacterium]|nr:tyrosine-protein phosphatase [Pseudomonadota bacterium]
MSGLSKSFFALLSIAMFLAGIPLASAKQDVAAQQTAQKARNASWAVLIDKEYNLYQVTPLFYRSAQFDKKQVANLTELKIQTVINLRHFHSDDAILADSGIAAVRVPMSAGEIGDDEVVAALRAIRQAEAKGAFLLHCQHGADRTGMITAMYRMLYQGWTRAQALDEMQNGGYGYHTIWRNIPTYIEQVDLDKIRRSVEAETL